MYFYQQDVYRSFLRTIPTETQQFQVFLDFLLYTGNSEAFVIVSDDTTYGHALEFVTRNDYSRVTVIKVTVETSSKTSIVNSLMQIKASLASVVFLYCDAHVAKVLLWTAKDFRMFRSDFFWVVSENVVLNTDKLYMLPSRIYAIMAEGVKSIDKFFLDRLTETYALVHTALASFSENERQSFLRKPETCTEMREWAHGEKLYR